MHLNQLNVTQTKRLPLRFEKQLPQIRNTVIAYKIRTVQNIEWKSTARADSILQKIAGVQWYISMNYFSTVKLV